MTRQGEAGPGVVDDVGSIDDSNGSGGSIGSNHGLEGFRSRAHGSLQPGGRLKQSLREWMTCSKDCRSWDLSGRRERQRKAGTNSCHGSTPRACRPRLLLFSRLSPKSVRGSLPAIRPCGRILQEKKSAHQWWSAPPFQIYRQNQPGGPVLSEQRELPTGPPSSPSS